MPKQEIQKLVFDEPVVFIDPKYVFTSVSDWWEFTRNTKLAKGQAVTFACAAGSAICVADKRSAVRHRVRLEATPDLFVAHNSGYLCVASLNRVLSGAFGTWITVKGKSLLYQMAAGSVVVGVVAGPGDYYAQGRDLVGPGIGFTTSTKRRSMLLPDVYEEMAAAYAKSAGSQSVYKALGLDWIAKKDKAVEELLKAVAAAAPKKLSACKHVADLDAYLEKLFDKDPLRFLGFAKSVVATLYVDTATSPEDLELESSDEAYQDPEAPEYFTRYNPDKEWDSGSIEEISEHAKTFDKP